MSATLRKRNIKVPSFISIDDTQTNDCEVCSSRSSASLIDDCKVRFAEVDTGNLYRNIKKLGVDLSTPINHESCSRSSNIQTARKKKSLKDVYLEERARGANSTVPPVSPIHEDSFSVESAGKPRSGSIWPLFSSSLSPESGSRTWNQVYVAEPLFDSRTTVLLGVMLYAIAYVWPPLLLIVFLLATPVVSYCFRENDFPVRRRQLFYEFINDGADSLPETFRNVILKNLHSTSKHIGNQNPSNNASIKLIQNDNPSQSSFSGSSIGSNISKDENSVDVSGTEDTIRVEENYWINTRGMQLHTVTMLPSSNQPIHGVICFCHGYSDNISYVKLVEVKRLVDSGLAFVAIEYEGHGLSDGLLALIEDWNCIIDDVAMYFSETLQTDIRFRNKPAFLMGESMGGAVAHDVYNRLPHQFNGVLFVSPMCKISDDMLPSPIIIDILKRLLEAFPLLGYLPLAPAKNKLDDVCFKVLEKRKAASLSPLNYSRVPRLATARELIDATQRISESLYDFDAPFLIIHGKDDVVTDPNLSQQLYDEAQSTDKTIHLYDTMWHALLGGEPDENLDRVFGDITKWIFARIPTYSQNHIEKCSSSDSSRLSSNKTKTC